MSELQNPVENPELPVVSAVGLSKVFRDFWNRPKAKAVNDLDFEVRRGEVLGLLGPNGSGKSTTIKMLLGLLYPSGGRLTVFGKSPRDVAIKKQIGYLPEETYLYKYLTAYETLDFFASLFNLSGLERRKRCEQLLDMVGLSHAKNRPVGEFSKGMARRIGLAQAMINDPQLLVLDEPTSGLDPLGCREVKDLILMLKKRGKTVIVTSHLLSDVEDVCDRVLILYGGQIRAQGSLNELLSIEKRNVISTPQLPQEVMARVLALLRENLTDEQFHVDHPRMTLEEFFLDVVNRAKQESVETFGARSGGNIAEYLSSDASADSSAEILDQLSGKAEAPKPVEEELSVEAAREARLKRQAEKRAENVLSNLSRENPASGEEAKEQEKIRKRDEELSKANEKLNVFLSGSSGKDDGE